MQSSVTYTMSMSEQELYECIEFYMKHKYEQNIEIISLKHKTRNWTEGHGQAEIDYSEPAGVEFKAVNPSV